MQSSFESTVENPVIEQETRAAEELDLPWQVVVHNDPVNLMSYVTMVFQKVFGLTKEKAEVHMLEVHQLGRSILWSGMRERAELYVQQTPRYLLWPRSTHQLSDGIPPRQRFPRITELDPFLAELLRQIPRARAPWSREREAAHS